MFKSLDLIRESSDEDLIFSTRFDSWYRKPLVFDEFKEFIEGGKVCFVGDPPVWKKHKVSHRNHSSSDDFARACVCFDVVSE